jgi:phosphoglycolate phosphatase-like HAD superfamily hydrolase
MLRFRGIILNVDGTLVDNNGSQARVSVRTLRQFDHTVRYKQVVLATNHLSFVQTSKR